MPIVTASLTPKTLSHFWEHMPTGLKITKTPGQNPVSFDAENLPPGATYELVDDPCSEFTETEFEIRRIQFAQPVAIHAEEINYRASALWNRGASVTAPVQMKIDDSLISMTGMFWQGRISEDVILDGKGRPNYGSLAEEGVLSLMGQRTPIHAGAQIGVDHERGQVSLVMDNAQGFDFWINGARCLLNKWFGSEGQKFWVEFSKTVPFLPMPYSEGTVALSNGSAQIREDATIQYADLAGKAQEMNTQLMQRLCVKDRAYVFVPGTSIGFDALGRIIFGHVIDPFVNELPEKFLRGQKRPVSRIEVVYDNENHATVTFIPDVVFYLFDLPKGAREIRTEQIP